jgi:hypothetical protein
MRRTPRPGDILLVAAVILLVLASAQQLEARADIAEHRGHVHALHLRGER